MTDYVNSPPHYKYGSFEVIDILEEAVALAPDPVKGSLQYQVLKTCYASGVKTTLCEMQKSLVGI